MAEKTKGRVSKTMASLANASPNAQQMFAAAGQIPTPGLHDNQGNDDDEPPSPHAALKAKLEVPAGSVAAQRQALEAARLAKEQADAAKAAADQASQLSRAEARARKEEAKRAAAAAAEAEELAKQASEKVRKKTIAKPSSTLSFPLVHLSVATQNYFQMSSRRNIIRIFISDLALPK